MLFKGLLKRYIDPRILGFLDYLRSDDVDRNWSGEFNGQQCRKRIFGELVAVFDFDYIVETGTFRRVTTEYFATMYDRAIHTIESEARNFGYAKARLWRRRNVEQYFGDGEEILQSLFESKTLCGSGFYYLDSHWGDNLPLSGEVSVRSKHDPDAVILIDDFQVPEDNGYKYDDYGGGKVLNLDYLMPIINAASLLVFFPSFTSEEETGAKRGSVLLAAGGRESALQHMKSVHRWIV